MEKGDLLTLAGGVIIVLVIAVLTNPHYLAGLSPTPEVPVPTTVETVIPTPSATLYIPVTPSLNETPAPEPTVAPPYQIVYSSDPFSYPKYKMPENMGTFGAGDLLPRGSEMVPFAFISEARGGLTRKFTIPYPVWVINTTVIANRTPQYGNFRMILCYANNGTVIDGEEILNRGSMIRVIQTSGAEMYMIITTAYIDSYRIDFETARNYYDTYRPA
ncbi:MAG: hypothetical protein PHT99_04055 [Methanoregula sp.]|nr:hypothetical protein [Methanoregula sp.]